MVAGPRISRSLLLLLAWALPASAAPVSFVHQVQPLLQERCGACHSDTLRSGGHSFASFAGVSPLVNRSQPAASLLLAVLAGNPPRMPRSGDPLSPAQRQLLQQWVAEGAKDDTPPPDPSTPASRPPQPPKWWSLRPLQRPALPANATRWGRTPVDAFLLAKLEQANLRPSPEADRRTLIRRLSLDLHGLLPDPAAVEAFVKDPHPQAYENLVDQLLASPRYGERWARHWLDTVHYGDSHGYDKDKPRLNGWPYRDYVIQALNHDTPYPHFVQQQLAADVLFPNQPHLFPALGFLAAGPWDFVGHQELKEGTTDKNLTRVLDRDDIVTTTISTFTSMTAHCARCHDHKFDPIPQADYYNLQAVFAGIDRADLPYDLDLPTHQKRWTLLAQKRALQLRLQPLLDKIEFSTTPEITELDDRIQDGRLQIVHIGEPKNPADAERKARLTLRVDADRARRQQLLDALIGPDTFAQVKQLQAEIKPLEDQLAQLPKPQLVYAGTNFFNRLGNFRPALTPRPVSLLGRGNVNAPLAPARPAALSCLTLPLPDFASPELETNEGARRAALARWITHPDNVLTWRSIVNRVWHYHFGAGLVDTPNDFGRMGSRPSHPELLDWLALWFRDDAQGSLKQLHRLLVTSAAYRQSSQARPDALAADADNRLLWRMNRLRLDAEAVRDGVLQLAGKLDLAMFGPPVRHFLFKDDHSPVYDYARFDPDTPGSHRRSIYRFAVRSAPDPFLERLDCPDPSILTPKRSTTLTAIQALVLLNDPFMVRMAAHWAARLQAASPSLDRQLELAAAQAFGQPLPAADLALLRNYAAQHGLPNLCRMLLNANQFLFVD